jgi:hypothetical protein
MLMIVNSLHVIKAFENTLLHFLNLAQLFRLLLRLLRVGVGSMSNTYLTIFNVFRLLLLVC